MRWLLACSLCLLGCATPQQRLAQQQQRTDWATVCENAPVGAGHSYSEAESKAMSRLGLWVQSVEEVNQRCLKTHIYVPFNDDSLTIWTPSGQAVKVTGRAR